MTDVATKPSRKKAGLVDAMVAKDRVTVFWFMFACIVAAGCAYYVMIVSETLKYRPPFVIMDGAGVFYSAPGVNFADAEPMHEALTELAVESMFDRGPNGLNQGSRLLKLCTRDGLTEIQKVIQTEEGFFRSQDIEQTFEIDEIKVLGAVGIAAGTQAKGRIYRRGQFGGDLEEVSEFVVQFKWVMNPDVRRTAAFPARIFTLYKYERIPLNVP